MAKQGIGTGSAANDGTGDSLRSAAGKINANFDEVYALLRGGGNSGSTLLAGILHRLLLEIMLLLLVDLQVLLL